MTECFSLLISILVHSFNWDSSPSSNLVWALVPPAVTSQYLLSLVLFLVTSPSWIKSILSTGLISVYQIFYSCLCEAFLLAPWVQDPFPLPTPQWEEYPLIWGPLLWYFYSLSSLHRTTGKTLGLRLCKSHFSPVHSFVSLFPIQLVVTHC